MPADPPDVLAPASLEVFVPRHQVIQVTDLESNVLHAGALVQRILEADDMVIHEFPGTIEPGEYHLWCAVRQTNRV